MSSKTGLDRAAALPAASWSLAARLTAWYATSAFALVLAATGFLYWALVTNLDREDDESLADRIRVLRMALDQPGDGAAVRREAEWASAAGQASPSYVRVLDAEGRLTAETPGMGDLLTPGTFPVPPTGGEGLSRGADVHCEGGRSFRVLAARTGAGIIQVALDRTREEDLLAGYRRSLWLVLGLALLGCAGGGYQVARRGLRPLREMAAAAGRIRPATLGERIAAAGLPAELAVLAGTLNAMLGRLEDSFARLARFSADIAHELRTPVNNLRGEAEVALSRPRSTEEYRDALGSCLEECGRLSSLIDRLLFLARAENPKAQVVRERLDLARELASVAEFYEAAAGEAGVRLAVQAEGAGFANLDRTLLRRAVGNLVENALAYSPHGGTITLCARRAGDAVRVEVADTGCGIPAADLPRIWDRFYRVDTARSTSKGGVGLGLPIVKSIVELHGGTAEVASEAGKGTRVVLVIPGSG